MAGYKLWIDALSINQEDILERGVQVKPMHRIYKGAAIVIIWLGPEADESGKGMCLVRILWHACKTGNDRILGDSLREHPDLLGKGSWRALSQLLRRKLFSAVYTFGAHNIDIMFSLIDRETRELGILTSGLNRKRIIHLNDEQYVQEGEAEEQVMSMLNLGRKSLSTDPKTKSMVYLNLRWHSWQPYPTGKHAPDEYHLLLDCVPETEDPAEKSWRGAFSRLVNQNADFCIAGKTLRSFFPSDHTAYENPRVARDPMEQMFRYLRTRRLMTTLTGFLGAAPHASQRADCIFLLPGCDVPLVLRPWGGQQYKIVGAWYLQGFMEGEALDS
ncbi:MAG: hypothetical protein LQ341_004836 [Variospora aurantia]|nr:MAG: hypothetical protein LQ341_004836 [Variospora aurantia]